MKKIYIILGILAAAMAFTACESELDIPKKGNLGSEDDFYKTDQDALQASVAMYSDLLSLHYGLGSMLDLLSDDCWAGGGNLGDNSSFQNLSAYTFGSSNETVEGAYSGLYSLIYDANLILGKFNAENATSGIRQSMAEAYFFRGFAHMYLGALWGTAPVVDHLLEPSEYTRSNSEAGACLAQAEGDLRAAIAMNALPSKNGLNDPSTGIRVTKEAAQAYLGKVLVFEKKYSEAAIVLDEVIGSGLYDLYRGDFGDILKCTADMCCESVLESNIVTDANNYTHLSMTMVMRGWRNDGLNFNAMTSGWRSSLHRHGGYGFFNPRKGLYEAFVAMEGENGYRLGQSVKTYSFLKNEMGLNVIKNMPGQEGYYSWKHRIIDAEVTTCWGEMDMQNNSNPRWMRYAEVLLLAAEAHAMGGGSKAATYLNAVRERAGLAPVSTVTMDDVKKEKRLELCLEGCRFIDLVRWGDAPAALANQGRQVLLFTTSETVTVAQENSGAGFVAGKHELLPFPEKEIILNKNMTQNPGWGDTSEE